MSLGGYVHIVVITSSPRKNGTTEVLAEQFILGAQESGHEVFRFDAAFEDVRPCLGCDYCRAHESRCVHKDSMAKLDDHIASAGLVVFLTPLYYFGMSAQLKVVIDRLYARNYDLMGSGKRAMLMAAAYDSNDWTMKALEAHYKTIVRYLKWEDAGMILAAGCGSREDIVRTDYPERAYRMGKDAK